MFFSFPQEAEVGREEWMLVPPKSLGVLGAIKTLQPTNRKFQTYVKPLPCRRVARRVANVRLSARLKHLVYFVRFFSAR